jgi:glutathione S-transferase
MHEIILHHYDMSPYAEKIRLALGVKRLAWRSVEIPMVMPKPHLTALTGGYRKTPVLQIGADIYCDTKTIVRALERVQPAPTLLPPGTEAIERGLSFWAETNFVTGVTLFFGLGEVFTPEFLEDRRKMIPGGVDPEKARAIVPALREQLRARLDLLERQLADGRPYLLGGAVSLADLSAYHPVWFLSRTETTRAAVERLPRLCAWRDRVAAIGHGEPRPLDAEEAVEIARRATPATAPAADPDDPNGRKPGDRVMVLPDDYGRDPVAGELVWSDAHEIAIRRVDERAGEVVVHFPREGYITLGA